MRSDVMRHFGPVREFQQAGYFETDHLKDTLQEVKASIKLGKLIAISGIVGSGKTLFLRRVQDELAREEEILIAKSLSLDKRRVTVPVLMAALFMDLAARAKEMEVVREDGGLLSIVLAGHPKLRNDLQRSSMEEIGHRMSIFNLDGIVASRREYIEWLLERCIKPQTPTEDLFCLDAIDLLAERLVTPLQIEH